MKTTRIVKNLKCFGKQILLTAQPQTSITYRHTSLYAEALRQSIENPKEYWAEAAEKLTWFRKWDKVLDNSNPPHTKWFVGGQMNHCYNSIDRHVENGRGSQNAIIYDSPVTNTIKKINYKELQAEVAHLAGVLSKHGVEYGDRVMIYMPMIPQAISAMMATVRIGAIHVVVFGGFAAKELSARINGCRPKVVLSASYGIEGSKLIDYKPMLDEAIALSTHKPKYSIVYNRPNSHKFEMNVDRDLDWDEEVASAKPHDCIPVDANDPMYLLYTSGTTGIPKAAVRPTAGHSVVLHWSMENVYGVSPGEVFWAASDFGWVVGHSYQCHAPLIHGNTTVVYEVYWAAADLGWAVGHSYGAHAPLLQGSTTVVFEGKPVGTPDASSFFRVIDEHNVSCLFTAPTALRVIKKADPHSKISKNYDLSKTLFVAGEHCDKDTAHWAEIAFKSPVLDNWWQTETGSPITSTCVGLGNRLNPPKGSTGLAVPGWDIRVVDHNGKELGHGQLGNLVAKLPMPLGTLSTIWEDDKRFVETYFQKYPGYYDTMDAGIMDDEGYISVMSRTDDVINVAGHRLSCGHLEEAIGSHYAVVESAVVAKVDKVKGHIPFGFIIPKSEFVNDNTRTEIMAEIIQHVREHIGPVAAFKNAVFVNRIPKTRSGKTPRKTLEAIINGHEYKISPTIEDPTVYPELEATLKKAGY